MYLEPLSQSPIQQLQRQRRTPELQHTVLPWAGLPESLRGHPAPYGSRMDSITTPRKSYHPCMQNTVLLSLNCCSIHMPKKIKLRATTCTFDAIVSFITSYPSIFIGTSEKFHFVQASQTAHLNTRCSAATDDCCSPFKTKIGRSVPAR